MNPQLDITDQRMLDAIDRLIQLNKIRFKKEACEAIGVEPQRLWKISSGKQHFTAENIRKMALEFNVNLNYLFGFEERFFAKKGVNKNVNREHNDCPKSA